MLRSGIPSISSRSRDMKLNPLIFKSLSGRVIRLVTAIDGVVKLTSQFWTNLFPTKLVDQHQKDIKRFATAIRWMRRLEVFFALIPIRISLKMWGLSDEFINYMVYPRYVDLAPSINN